MSLREKLKTGLKIGILGTAVVISSYAVCDKIFCQGQYISKSNKFILPNLFGRTEITEGPSGCYVVSEIKVPFGINKYKDKPDMNGECVC